MTDNNPTDGEEMIQVSVEVPTHVKRELYRRFDQDEIDRMVNEHLRRLNDELSDDAQ